MKFVKSTRLIALSLIVLAGFGLSYAYTANAAGFQDAVSGGLNSAAPDALKGSTNLPTIIGGIVSALIGFIGVLLFLYLLYGGFLWMTSQGDKAKVESAQNVIKSAIIGMIIIALSYAIANFVIEQLSGAVSQTTPATAPATPPPPANP
ncbi:hypothetical protein KKD88_00950 [Patescibacteria group bacterium]|nr:hypothetical protein [Patescibacteria group bacterium]